MGGINDDWIYPEPLITFTSTSRSRLAPGHNTPWPRTPPRYNYHGQDAKLSLGERQKDVPRPDLHSLHHLQCRAGRKRLRKGGARWLGRETRQVERCEQ